VLESLAAKQLQTHIDGRIADVRDRKRIFRLLNEFKPDVVFHAAALKHVLIWNAIGAKASKPTCSAPSTSRMPQSPLARLPWS